MRIVVQKVSQASVKVEAGIVSEIGKGLLILVGVEDKDTQEDIDWLTAKITQLRIFDDEKGVMNLSVKDIDGEILIVSQFTLHASTKKGNRPSYIRARNLILPFRCTKSLLWQLKTQLAERLKPVVLVP